MPFPTHDRLRRMAVLTSVAAAAGAAVVAFTPATAMAATYTCSNGVLYEDGVSLGTRTKSNAYDLGGGLTTWCSGARVVAAYKVTNN